MNNSIPPTAPTPPQPPATRSDGVYRLWRQVRRQRDSDGPNLVARTALTCMFAVRPLGFEPRTCGLRVPKGPSSGWDLVRSRGVLYGRSSA